MKEQTHFENKFLTYHTFQDKSAYMQGVDDGIEYEQRLNGWHMAEDGYPNDGDRVLLYVRWKGCYHYIIAEHNTMEYNDGILHSWNRCSLEPDDVVVAWKLLIPPTI